MKKITITQIKPNPSGKDRFGHLTPNLQLTAEWVDFKNTGNEDYPLENIILQHLAYSPSSIFGRWDDIMDFKGILKPEKVVRIHSGNEIPIGELALEDRINADHHLFTGENYVWNNDRSDSPRLVIKISGSISEVDKASYDAHPIEGKILKRVGERLI
jgi:hypothetical protein